MIEQGGQDFLPEEQAEPAGPAMPTDPSGLPHIDTSGTTAAADPYGMIAPGGMDPEDDLPAEVIQAYQEDLVGRAMLIMTDNRMQKGAPSSPADAFMNRMNIRGAGAPEAIGSSVATMMIAITTNAKSQDVQYPGEALLAGGFEIIQMAMDLAREGGIFPDLPTEDDPTYQDVTVPIFLEAAKAFGEHLIETGQVDQQEYADILQGQMEDEAALGELDDWDPMEMMGPDSFANLMNRGVGLAQQKTAAASQPPAEEMPVEQPPMEQ